MRHLARPIFLPVLMVSFVWSVPAHDSPQNGAGGLSGKSWRLVRFQGSDGKTLAPDDPAKYTIALEPDGGVSVRIDCNRGHGTWKSAGPNQIQFGRLARTRAMCPPAPLNNRIPKDWEHERSYVLKDGHLFLSLESDGGICEFEPMGAQGGGATGSASENQASREPLLSNLPATFIGILPCADCPGIRYQVNLLPDHTFSSCMIYADRNGSFDDSGSWQFGDDGKTLLLQGAHGAPEKFALPDNHTLRKLDADGHENESKLNYDLGRAWSLLPLASCRAANSDASLKNTYWMLRFLGETSVAATFVGPVQPYLILDPESRRVSVWGGCNQIAGTYELGGGYLTFGEMAGTLMACREGMDTEKAFLKALAHAKAWKIEGQQLVLLDEDGHLLARLEASNAN